MAEVQSLRKGDVYEEEKQLWRVLEYQHIKVARGGATIRLKLRNIRSGANVEKTYNNGERVQEVTFDKDQVQFQYVDGDLYYFMNTETFEQVVLTREALEGVVEFLTDNQVLVLETYEGEPIKISLLLTPCISAHADGVSNMARITLHSLLFFMPVPSSVFLMLIHLFNLLRILCFD